jgi:hypothetical protein
MKTILQVNTVSKVKPVRVKSISMSNDTGSSLLNSYSKTERMALLRDSKNTKNSKSINVKDFLMLAKSI